MFQTSPTTQRQGSNRSKNSKRLSDLDEEPDLNSNGQKTFNDYTDKRKNGRKNDNELYDLEGHPEIRKHQAHWYPPVTLNCQCNCIYF